MRDGSIGGPRDRAAAEGEFREAVKDIFGESCKAAWLSGSFLYHGAKPGRSDIDVVIVLEDSTSIPADDPTIDRIRAFVDVYLDVHNRLGLDPDLEFPAEYVVPASIDQAINWRGLALRGKVADHFPPVEHKDYWLGRPDRWFNAWLSETAFSRFLTGDSDFHTQAKLTAWKTIIRFLMLRSGRRAMGLDDFWPGLAQFGVKETYLPFWPVEEGWVRRAFDSLEAEGMLQKEGDRVVPLFDALRNWEEELETIISADNEEGPLLLPVEKHDEIAAYTVRRWDAMSGLPAALETSGHN